MKIRKAIKNEEGKVREKQDRWRCFDIKMRRGREYSRERSNEKTKRERNVNKVV